MDKFTNWLATTPLGTAFKVFVAFLFGAALFTWTQDGEISFGAWQTWLIGALAVSVPIVINWLNPSDSRYGRGSGE